MLQPKYSTIQLVKMRCVLDGAIIELEDDGHSASDASRSGSKRRKIERVLEKRDQNGDPIWFVLERLQEWQPAEGFAFAPILKGMPPVWGKSQDKALAENLKIREMQREEAKARVYAGAATVTGLGQQLTNALSAAGVIAASESDAIVSNSGGAG